MQMYSHRYKTPQLTNTTSKGQAQTWQGFVIEDVDGIIRTYTVYGLVGGLKTQSEYTVIQGKNIGRSNETSPLNQAMLEINADAEKKKQKGYLAPGEVAAVRPLPMLAYSYADRAHGIKFPCFVQPKYDGFRCLYSTALGFWSRQGKEYLKAVTAHLGWPELPASFILDGELMLPSKYTFQQTCSAIKKFDPVLSPQLEYVVYDIICPGEPAMSFEQRSVTIHGLLKDELFNPPASVCATQTYECESEADLYAHHKSFIASGFEGTMVRNSNAPYKVGHRSGDLLKLKDFQDAEFKIVSVGEGKGKMKGCAILTCVTSDGKTFEVVPEGSLASKQATLAAANTYVGKQYTVRFQELSDTGVPRFPVGVGLRADFD